MAKRYHSQCLRTSFQVAALLCLLAPPMVPGVPARWQDTIETKVQEAISLLLNNEISKGMATLKELGSPAVPFVLAYVSREHCCPLVRLRLLQGFVSSTNGQEADAALTLLLSDEQPELRGYAASELGKRKARPAIALLISLLDDKADTRVFIDMNDRRPNVPVRDSAIAALESITGLTLAKGKNKEKQAKAWLGWWQKHKDQQ